jgi:D-hexose-6-phosphate mutarotase
MVPDVPIHPFANEWQCTYTQALHSFFRIQNVDKF